MMRMDAIGVLAEYRGNAISVATMQSIMAWRDLEQGSKDHIDISDCMGCSSTFGLGIALSQPDRKVIVLDGDGSLLMQLGSLVTIAGAEPPNLYHIVFDNGVYETTGNQPVPAQGKFNLCQIALGAGYRAAVSFDDPDTLRAELPALLQSPGPVLIRLVIEVEQRPVRISGIPLSDQVETLRASLVPAGS